MRNRSVSGPLPSYFNETFPLARHRHPADDDEAREKGKTTFVRREIIKELVFMIIDLFLFRNLFLLRY